MYVSKVIELLVTIQLLCILSSVFNCILDTQEVTTMVAIATSIPIQCRVSIHPYHMILLFLDHFTTQLTTEALRR